MRIGGCEGTQTFELCPCLKAWVLGVKWGFRSTGLVRLKGVKLRAILGIYGGGFFITSSCTCAEGRSRG